MISNNSISKAFAENESKFPQIPVPNLKDTIQKYLNTIKAVSSKEEYMKSLNLVESFMQKTGPTLQNRLLLNAKNSKNWVIDVFKNRQPLTKLPYATNSSFLIRHKFPSQVEAAARIIYISIIIKIIIKKNKFEQITRLCPTQFYNFFNSSRIPTLTMDILESFSNETYNHVIILHKNSFYKVCVSLDYEYLISQIEMILKMECQNTLNTNNFIGVLTTEERENWVDSRDYFLKLSKENVDFIKDINTSLMIISLEEHKSTQLTLHELSHLCLLSDGNNRYFDKTVQYIIYKDGYAGLNINRKVINITNSNEIIKFIVNFDKLYTFNKEKNTPNNKMFINDYLKDLIENENIIKSPSLPIKLSYNLDSKLKNDISKAYSHLENIKLFHDVFFFNQFGSLLIGQNYSIKIDSFIQMAIQYTYFKLYHKYPVVLQPVHTRKFFMGSSEALRALSLQSINFVASLMDKKAPNAFKQRLGYVAFKYHFQQVLDTSNGLGIDRHLVGLQSVLYGDPLPEIFKDKLYERSRRCDIITISFETEYISISHFFPPFYGTMTIAYFIRSDRIDFTITSKNDDCKLFLETLSSSLSEMYEIFFHKQKF